MLTRNVLTGDAPPLEERTVPLEMDAEAFRSAGHQLVDRIANWLNQAPSAPVVRDASPSEVRAALHSDRTLPEAGAEPAAILDEAADLLFRHSLFNGHPRFFGYITSSPAPIGALADLLAAAVNQNVGAWRLSPMATEIEGQTVRWLAELIGYPVNAGGLLVSGGNMANFVCFLAARTAVAGEVRAKGMAGLERRLRVYCSTETHTWIHKAADMFGLGTDAIRWIPADDRQQMNPAALEEQIVADVQEGGVPMLVVGTAGTVSTGAVDPLAEIAAICRRRGIWFHVDGAYGALAARVPGAPSSLAALADADSIAVDPHKWLYSPLEAGCALVRRPEDLRRTFSYHPSYYHFDHEMTNYFDYGPQNSRGFRALKVWLALRQVGLTGYQQMIGDDIRLAQHLHALVDAHPDFEAFSRNLSITTFRYVPAAARQGSQPGQVEDYVRRVNQELLTRIERSGEAFLSNAIVGGRFALRACIVNFRTTLQDIEALPPLLARVGREVEAVVPR